MTPEEEMRRFADSFGWRDGFRSLIEEEKSNREIVEILNLTDGGAIKRASAIRTAQRYRKPVGGGSGQTLGGHKGSQDARVLEALKRRTAAARIRHPGLIGWKATVAVKSNGKGAGTRGQKLAPFGGTNAVADTLKRGDYREAENALSRALMQQYGAESFLEVQSFERLDLQFWPHVRPPSRPRLAGRSHMSTEGPIRPSGTSLTRPPGNDAPWHHGPKETWRVTSTRGRKRRQERPEQGPRAISYVPGGVSYTVSYTHRRRSAGFPTFPADHFR